MRTGAMAGAIAMTLSSWAQAADLSPGRWPQAEREGIEAQEQQSWSPPEARTVATDRGGLVSATASPIAVRAGIEALRQGGTAADAAATVALTQVATQLGSVVSYAGIFSMLYYEASTGTVHSMDAGFNSYLGETDPATIPVSDMGGVSFAPTPTAGGDKGRATLVPGFMAGIEAMHGRFGRLRFDELFAPAIWYSERGVRISAVLAHFFQLRQRFLVRTPEGRAFMAQAGGEMPRPGDLFVQAELAGTLRRVAEVGAEEMYGGAWAQAFVEAVRREGGRAAPEDLARYRPIWSEPYRTTAFGHTVHVNGPPHYGAHNIVPALNMAEALRLDARGPYRSDVGTFAALTRIGEVVLAAPNIRQNIRVADFLEERGIDASPEAQLGQAYAREVAPLLDRLFVPAPVDEPRHSNAIVVVDGQGNIAAITHTINTVVWGDTGIVVGGIPIPDSAGFQQERLATIEPGARVPHEIVDTIVLAGERPVLATAGIGASIIPETLRTLVGVLAHGQDLATVTAAPALLSNFDPSRAELPPSARPFAVPEGAYPGEFVAGAREAGINLVEVPAPTVAALRGTLAAVAIDRESGRRSAADQPGVITYNGALGERGAGE